MKLSIEQIFSNHLSEKTNTIVTNFLNSENTDESEEDGEEDKNGLIELGKIENTKELALIIDIIWLNRKEIKDKRFVVNKLYKAANSLYNNRKSKVHEMSERAMREVGMCDLERIGIQYESSY